MDRVSILIAAIIVTLFALVLLKVLAPSAYDKHVLRDAVRPSPSRASKLVGVLILAVVVFLAVRFGLDLVRSSGHEAEMSATTIAHSREGQIAAWVGLSCVSVTGVLLCVFPVVFMTKLLRGRIITISTADYRSLSKLKIIGRLVGILFLVVGALIARQLV